MRVITQSVACLSIHLIERFVLKIYEASLFDNTWCRARRKHQSHVLTIFWTQKSNDHYYFLSGLMTTTDNSRGSQCVSLFCHAGARRRFYDSKKNNWKDKIDAHYILSWFANTEESK